MLLKEKENLASPSNKYARYSTRDFDNFDCLKLSKGVWLLLLFVLRGYLVWLMSVTNMNDRIGIIQWIYPEPALFYLSLLSGGIGIWAIVIISLRRPDASNWVKSSWQNIRVILFLALTFDFIVNILGYFYWQLHSSTGLIVNSLLVVLFSGYLYRSQRLKINIEEFPEKLPE